MHRTSSKRWCKTRRPGRRAAVAVALLLALAACSGDAELFPKSGSAIDLGLTRPEWIMSGGDHGKTRVVSAVDLVGPDGSCAGDPAASPGSQALNFQAGPQAPSSPNANPAPPANPAPAPVLRGVALGMTECEVVRILGRTERVEISANERGQRSLTLTYPQGSRPGIYRFAAGRLVSVESAGEPPAPQNPAKKKAAKKQTPS